MFPTWVAGEEALCLGSWDQSSGGQGGNGFVVWVLPGAAPCTGTLVADAEGRPWETTATLWPVRKCSPVTSVSSPTSALNSRLTCPSAAQLPT